MRKRTVLFNSITDSDILQVCLAVHALMGLCLNDFSAVRALFFEVGLEDFADDQVTCLAKRGVVEGVISDGINA
ncbi:MAG: hypothetical protein JZU49_05225, partial [Sulfuricurvum sp.]|nr:hypothetical protein [Sulfuricurvum sp.]